MSKPTIASKDAWLKARLDLLEKEKAASKARDELTQARQSLPWVRIEKPYRFIGAEGETDLAGLFDMHSQLIVYHFMFDPGWQEGCKSCSLIADHYAPSIVHLAARDVAFATVSAAPWPKLEAFRRRMDWRFRWYSAGDSDFNRDFHVTYTEAEIAAKEGFYNFKPGNPFPVSEAPGVSVFAKDEAGAVFHTYSAYARALEGMIGAYNLLDLVPKGRDERKLTYGMEWVRHKDRYGDADFVDPYTDLAKD